MPSQQGAPPMTTQRLTFAASPRLLPQGQRQVREGSESDDLYARIGFDDAHHRVHCKFLLGNPHRWLIAVIAKAIPPVKPGGILERAHQRRGCSGEYRDCRSAQSSAVNRAFCVPCSTATLPATTVIASTLTWGERKAMISATASSDAVSVSMRMFLALLSSLMETRISQRRMPGHPGK